MKTGLALSGGGAIGAAHIGVLKVLEEQNIKINYISGTSAGAIVGLLYADGGMKAIENFFNQLREAGLFSRSAIILKRNEKIFSIIEELLRENVQARHFNDLKIKFIACATDISTGEAVALDFGDPVSAVMASATYPGVFPVQNFHGRSLVDGGLTRNLPASILKEKGNDFIIGSNLYSITKLPILTQEEKIKIGLLTVAVRSIEIMSKIISEYEMKYCNFCFLPPVETYSWYNFEKIEEIRRIGREYAQAEVNNFKKALISYKHSQKKGLLDSILQRD